MLVYYKLFSDIEDKIYSATVLWGRGMFKSTFQFKNYFLNFMYLPTYVPSLEKNPSERQMAYVFAIKNSIYIVCNVSDFRCDTESFYGNLVHCFIGQF